MRPSMSALIACLLVLPAFARADDGPLHQRIDRIIAAQAGGPVSPTASDGEFLRRVSLDLAGKIPTAAETRRFLADRDPGKRVKLIDHLLNSADFPRRMQEAITVMLLERQPGTTIPDQDWTAYVRKSFERNKPWDAFVRELLANDGANAESRASIRFLVDGGRADPHQLTMDVSRLLLGMNLHCARCHNHPNVREYRQAHYFGLYAYLNQSKLGKDSQQKPLVIETAAKGKVEFQSVFTNIKKETGPKLPEGTEVEVPTFPKGKEYATPPTKGKPGVPHFQPRRLLAEHLTSSKNSRFVRNSVNRFWFLMMGRGLVQPLDLMHGENPASHPEVLDMLAAEFVAHKFDVKHLLREIALSKAYQRSSRLPSGVKAEAVPADRYRTALAKPLSAEQLAWSMLTATDNVMDAGKPADAAKSKFTVKDYVNGRIAAPSNLADLMTLFSGTFGNPAGEAEDEFQPSMGQSLFLLNDKLVVEWLKPTNDNLTARLDKIDASKSLADELYLSILSRMPAEEERTEVVQYLADNKERRSAAITDLAWALLASAEFRLNH